MHLTSPTVAPSESLTCHLDGSALNDLISFFLGEFTSSPVLGLSVGGQDSEVVSPES